MDRFWLRSMSHERIATLGEFAKEALYETLWPTRCALCDVPGQVLCDRCARNLPFLDPWRACPRCGSPYGLVQCDLCNSLGLARLDRTELPFDHCASAVIFDEATGKIVRTFKDQGEQRLATVMAKLMARSIGPLANVSVVTAIPATKRAQAKRGFDHGELLGREVARLLRLPFLTLLARPSSDDQRRLGARERIDNLHGGFSLRKGVIAPREAILVDDVLTTGATLCAACDALRRAGCRKLRCLTFARV